ncbi:MAG: hypothetical protein ACRENE_22495 [Polyangiaceae bacterium]
MHAATDAGKEVPLRVGTRWASRVTLLRARETQAVSVGGRATRALVAGAHNLASLDSSVRRVKRPRAMPLGPDEVLLILEVMSRTGLTAKNLVQEIERIEANVRSAHPEYRLAR